MVILKKIILIGVLRSIAFIVLSFSLSIAFFTLIAGIIWAGIRKITGKITGKSDHYFTHQNTKKSANSQIIEGKYTIIKEN